MLYTINSQGQEYYKKLRKDTNKSIFLAGPLLIFFFAFCSVLILGWTLYTWYIIVVPFSLITLLLYFSPLVLRGRYINAFITNIKVSEYLVEMETFGWFFFPPKKLEIMKSNILLQENSSDLSNFPANYKIKVTQGGDIHTLYLIREFYDNWEEVTLGLKQVQVN